MGNILEESAAAVVVQKRCDTTVVHSMASKTRLHRTAATLHHIIICITPQQTLYIRRALKKRRSAGRPLSGRAERRVGRRGLRFGHGGRSFPERGQLLHGVPVAVERYEYERSLQRVKRRVERPRDVGVGDGADQRKHPSQAHHQRQAHVDLEVPARPVDGRRVVAAVGLEPVVGGCDQPDSAEERHVIGGDRCAGRKHEQRDQRLGVPEPAVVVEIGPELGEQRAREVRLQLHRGRQGGERGGCQPRKQ